jgi:hypothetical protein
VVDPLEDALIAADCGLYCHGNRLVETAWQEIAVADGGKDRSLQLVPPRRSALGFHDLLAQRQGPLGRSAPVRMGPWRRRTVVNAGPIKAEVPIEIAE